MAMQKGLGRGLDALIPGANIIANDDNNVAVQATTNEIDINLIDPNPHQPRTDFNDEELEELATSIRANGIIQPLTLRQVGDRYQIVAGERRFRASKLAGLQTVKAVVADVPDDKMRIIALIENIQRADLNPLEEARSYQQLLDEHNFTQEQLAEQVGKKRSTITNYLRLLNLPVEIQDGLAQKLITMGHARAILSVEDESTQKMLFDETVRENFSVRRVEELARQYNEKSVAPENPESPEKGDSGNQEKTDDNKIHTNEQYAELKNQLQSQFGTKVNMTVNNAGKGKITISFTNGEQLERILYLLDKAKD